MTDAQGTLIGLMGWIRAVAHKFTKKSEGIEREDYEQEAAAAILQAEATEEWLAKVIAIRAMRKFRDRYGPDRVTRRNGDEVRKPLKRCPTDALLSLVTTAEPSGVFWGNFDGLLSDGEAKALRLWVESDDSLDEIGRQNGVSGRTMRYWFANACHKLRQRWGVEDPGVATLKRMT